jgi:hypothetical protein
MVLTEVGLALSTPSGLSRIGILIRYIASRKSWHSMSFTTIKPHKLAQGENLLELTSLALRNTRPLSDFFLWSQWRRHGSDLVRGGCD